LVPDLLATDMLRRINRHMKRTTSMVNAKGYNSASTQNEILSGIKVIDCSQFIPGPYATLICADLGAEVVKVEPPAGDPMRYAGTLDKDGSSAAYKLLNKGKTIVKIDLKAPEGVGEFKKLIAGADVLLESYRPGVFGKLGFSAEDLQKINPGLVHVALTGYGQTGRYSERAGHDLNYVAPRSSESPCNSPLLMT
jgi:alpha-methylacyl-CoA racemase